MGRGPYDRHVTPLFPLTTATRHDLPPPCVSCTFWQHDRIATDERRKDSWGEAFERDATARSAGCCTTAPLPGDDPVRAVLRVPPRARAAGGPARPRGGLVTCAFLEADDPAGTPSGSCSRRSPT